MVSKGDQLGTVKDFFGNTIRRITAPTKGVVLHVSDPSSAGTLVMIAELN